MAIIRRTYPGYPAFGWAGSEFARLQNEMNRLFENYFEREAVPGRSVFPPVNIYEDEGNLYLTSELPGMEAKDIDINVESNSIQLKGERKIESEGENVCYHRRERESGSFSKKISLQIPVNTSKVSAEFNNGVLKVTLPKAEEAKPKKINVKVS